MLAQLSVCQADLAAAREQLAAAAEELKHTHREVCVWEGRGAVHAWQGWAHSRAHSEGGRTYTHASSREAGQRKISMCLPHSRWADKCCVSLCLLVLAVCQAALEAESRHQLESALKGTAAAASTLKEAKVREGAVIGHGWWCEYLEPVCMVRGGRGGELTDMQRKAPAFKTCHPPCCCRCCCRCAGPGDK